ncbi:jg12990, partial [Pararge aegeria aegeria]
APAVRLHLSRSSAFLEHWTMEVCVVAYTTTEEASHRGVVPGSWWRAAVATGTVGKRKNDMF